MVDTVKMRRPDFRNPSGPGGRVEHDSLGNAVWTRTRATDNLEPPDTAGLALADEPPPPASPNAKDSKKK
jgi:hypothetical protein